MGMDTSCCRALSPSPPRLYILKNWKPANANARSNTSAFCRVACEDVEDVGFGSHRFIYLTVMPYISCLLCLLFPIATTDANETDTAKLGTFPPKRPMVQTKLLVAVLVNKNKKQKMEEFEPRQPGQPFASTRPGTGSWNIGNNRFRRSPQRMPPRNSSSLSTFKANGVVYFDFIEF